MLVIRILVGVAGAFIAIATLASALRTVVVPRGEQTILSRATVFTVRRAFDIAAGWRTSWHDQEAVKARAAPVATVLLSFVWAAGVIFGMSGVYWAINEGSYRSALVTSGSSLTTLGFQSDTDLATLVVIIIEGLIGLGLIALLISFLPTIYGAFSRRETAVAKLHLRSTGPDGTANAESMLIRRNQIEDLDSMVAVWAEWEDWFVEIEETHTSFPMLVFFRSPVPDRSWITSAGMALDAAALYESTIGVPREPRAELMIRTGSLALRRVCDYFDFEYDPDPAPDDPITIERHEWEAAYDRFVAAGVPVMPDRDQAWRDFAGWRVNYDRPLITLAAFVDAPMAQWSSDRPVTYRRPTILRHRR